MFGLAHCQIIVILYRDNRDDLLGACQLIDRDIREPDRIASRKSSFLRFEQTYSHHIALVFPPSPQLRSSA